SSSSRPARAWRQARTGSASAGSSARSCVPSTCRPGRLRAFPPASRARTWPFPGFPTDLQAQYMALMTQAEGESVISEYVHENRFQHVRELAKMGAGITVEGRLHAIVHGPCRLHGGEVGIPDIRSGAALVIAAMCAQGDTVLRNAWHVERGYEDMVGKLSSVGARIKGVSVDPDPAVTSHTYE